MDDWDEQFVCSSLSTAIAGMPSFLCYISNHHRWLSDTCTQLVCTSLRTLVKSSRDKNSGAVSPDYLCCFYCCNWKRFKETHCIYVTLHHSFSRYLAGGAGWQQHDNKCCVFFAHLFWPSHWKPGSPQAAGPSIILFWVFLFILTSGDYLLPILFLAFISDMSGHRLFVHYCNLHSPRRCTSIRAGIRT